MTQIIRNVTFLNNINYAFLPFLPVPMRKNNGINKFNNAFSVRVWLANTL